MRQVVCEAADLEPGGMVSATLGPMPIVVIRSSDGSLHSMLDKCLHQGGRLSRGRLLTATDGATPGDYREEDGRTIVKCPWHGYEYDVRTGCTLFDEERRLRVFTVVEEDGQIVVET